MKKKVLLTRKLHDFALLDLKKYYDIEIHQGKIPMPKKTLLKKIRNKDGLICFPYDSIDIDVKYAKKQGISIGYTPEVLTDATADLTFALILDLYDHTQRCKC